MDSKVQTGLATRRPYGRARQEGAGDWRYSRMGSAGPRTRRCGTDAVITGHDKERAPNGPVAASRPGERTRSPRPHTPPLGRSSSRRRGRTSRCARQHAGVFPFDATHDADGAVPHATFLVHVKPPLVRTGASAPRLPAKGGDGIVNITATVAGFGRVGRALYGATKAALTLLTTAWAAEYGPQSVDATPLTAEPTKTRGTQQIDDALDQPASTLPPERQTRRERRPCFLAARTPRTSTTQWWPPTAAAPPSDPHSR
jgi:short chain dehydrogenase